MPISCYRAGIACNDTSSSRAITTKATAEYATILQAKKDSGRCCWPKCVTKSGHKVIEASASGQIKQTDK